MNKTFRGFMTLFVVLIISAIVAIYSLISSTILYQLQTLTLVREHRNEAILASLSCLSIVQIEHATNPAYALTGQFSLGTSSCSISGITPVQEGISITATAVVSGISAYSEATLQDNKMTLLNSY